MDPYIGEIRLFAGKYVPQDWLPCDGRLLTVAANEALFSLIGFTYGGDGRSNFNLPDLRGLVVCGTGHGTASSNTYGLAQTFGNTTVQLTSAQMPVHKHDLLASKQPAETASPQTALFGTPPQLSGNVTVAQYVNGTPAPTTRNLATTVLSTTGGGQPHANLMPTLGVTYIICSAGLYPIFN